ncbi:M6 family metalloprotease domain-containing protein [Calditerricola satsumensis]|uniref:Peptidase M6-like domain-containing protein n=1 Tax=Calditerricola satsumensis TaxID=373054 RepID=A0A8J3B7L2_9BACI|nr:M6 family metalloprotease domain-containing protein [Calditerricola satsumensis]GGJ99135.1 hypothetical protein GCM10007043_11510 [Calditerricola satsumensis]
MRRWVSGVLVVMLIGVAAWSGSGTAGKSVGPSAPHFVTPPDEVKAAAQARGIDLGQRAHGRPHQVNPQQSVGTKPLSAEQKVLALYLRFPEDDGPPSRVTYQHVPRQLLADLLFGNAYNPYTHPDFARYREWNGIPAPTDRTLANYYREISRGRVTVTGEVVEVQMPRGYSAYRIGQRFGAVQNDYGDYTMAMLLEDAIRAADPYVDFSRYAVNGEVPNVFLIHEGTGAEWNLDPRLIWSHKWEYADAWYYYEWAKTGTAPEYDPHRGIWVDGVKVNAYAIEPEVGGDLTGYLGAVTGPYPPQVGIYAHEFAHVLGLPDLYDYDYDSEGVGGYSLMAGGSWARFPDAAPYSGNSPVHPDAWSKAFWGLADVHVVTEGQQTFSLKPAAAGGGVVKLVVPGSGGTEYFLVENRQPVGFDKGLLRYGDVRGLAIYHVDENVLARNFWRPNEAQNWFQNRMQQVEADPQTGETHYAVSLLQADNRWDLEKNVNRGDAGDLYRTGQALTPTSTPNSGSYYVLQKGNGAVPNFTGAFVRDIVEHPDGTITFTAGFLSR